VPVGPVRRYLGEDLTHPDADGTRLRVLGMEQRDEALGRRQQLAMDRRRVVISRTGASRVHPRHAHRHRGPAG
jgi:hypothetical protein